ncbi:MAG: ABC transporter substrate-binding protein [Pseudomonadota bacterium]
MNTPRISRHRSRFVAAVAGLVLAVAGGNAVADDEPIDVINSAVDALNTGLQGQRDTLAQDRAALIRFVDGLLAPRFDRNYAGRLVLARHWRDATTEQKKRFIDGLYNSLIRRYADGVLEFEEDLVEVLEPRAGDNDEKRATVRTVVTIGGGETVPVNYGLVNRGDNGWKVFDVTIEGISYVRNFRAEIDEEVKRTSLDAVITRLETEAAEALGELDESDVSAATASGS